MARRTERERTWRPLTSCSRVHLLDRDAERNMRHRKRNTVSWVSGSWRRRGEAAWMRPWRMRGLTWLGQEMVVGRDKPAQQWKSGESSVTKFGGGRNGKCASSWLLPCRSSTLSSCLSSHPPHYHLATTVAIVANLTLHWPSLVIT